MPGSLITARRALALLGRAKRRGLLSPTLRQHRKLTQRCFRDWLGSANVSGFGVGYRETDGVVTDQIAITVFVKRKRAKRLLRDDLVPRTIKLPGIKMPVELDVCVGRPGSGQAVYCGDGISLVDYDQFGTLGCLVVQKDDPNTVRGLTAGHVCPGQRGDAVNWLNYPFEVDPEKDPIIGKLLFREGLTPSETTFDNRWDVATFALDAAIAAQPAIRQLGAFNGLLDVLPEIKSRVRKMGVGGGAEAAGRGRVMRTDFEHTLSINGQPTGFYGLIQCSPFTIDGDSGAPVIDDLGKLVGIVLGGREDGPDAYTAVMPAAAMFKHYGLRLATQDDLAV